MVADEYKLYDSIEDLYEELYLMSMKVLKDFKEDRTKRIEYYLNHPSGFGFSVSDMTMQFNDALRDEEREDLTVMTLYVMTPYVLDKTKVASRLQAYDVKVPKGCQGLPLAP